LKKVIKLSSLWQNVPINQTPDANGIYGEYKFEIDNDCDQCDYWVIWGGLKKTETVKVPESNIIYLVDEVHEQRKFNQKFLNQFPVLFSCRTDLIHSNMIKVHDMGIWHMPYSYNELFNLEVPKKKYNLSSVTSDYTILPGHKKRYAFVNQLKGHFKENFHLYGRGIYPIKNKFDGIAPYRYSVAIENTVMPNYFTEKIFECFLTYTIPFYFGCPNLSDYFNEESFVRIDPSDLFLSIEVIENEIAGYNYDKRIENLKDSRDLFFKRYHIFPALIHFIEQNYQLFQDSKQSKMKVVHEKHPKFHLKNNFIRAKNIVFGKINNFK